LTLILRVAERWVINASPLILLAKAELVHLLPSLCEELVIPNGVAVEIQAGRSADAACAWLETKGASFIRPDVSHHSALARWHGGNGEAEVISFALQNPDFIAALDDRRARAFAVEHGVRVLGSLRIIVIAKEKGLISRAKPALEKLRGVGAYVSNALIDRAIQLAGE
jgi:predicted nucleic acid-binding protein